MTSMRVSEVARRLGVAPSSVYRLIDRDALPGGTQLGSERMVEREPFDAWLRGELTVEQWRLRDDPPEVDTAQWEVWASARAARGRDTGRGSAGA